MKTTLFTFLLLVPLLGQAQFSFEPNADSTISDTPQDTSAIFQYKFIEASAWHFSPYLELTYNRDSIWSYRRVNEFIKSLSFDDIIKNEQMLTYKTNGNIENLNMYINSARKELVLR